MLCQEFPSAKNCSGGLDSIFSIDISSFCVLMNVVRNAVIILIVKLHWDLVTVTVIVKHIVVLYSICISCFYTLSCFA